MQTSSPAVLAEASGAQVQDVSGESSATAAGAGGAAAAATKSEIERVAMDTGDTAAPQVLSDGWTMRRRTRAETVSQS